MVQSISSMQQVLRVLPIALLLAACGSGDSSDNKGDPVAQASGVPSMAEGFVVKGPVAASTVTIHQFNNDGSRGPQVAGPFVTNANGHWSGSIPFSDQPYEVVSRGGRYIDEASGTQITRANDASDVLSGILDFSHSSQTMVTPFTSSAIVAARHSSARDLIEFPVAARQARLDMELAFGFDLTTVQPDFTTDNGGSEILAGQRYAALLGGFSSLLHENPELSAFTTAQVHSVRNALIEDLADSQLDGRNVHSTPVKVRIGNGELLEFAALSSGNISALLLAANSYAADQPQLTHVAFGQETVLAFGTEGGRLLDGGQLISVSGPGYLTFETGEGRVYRRNAQLKFNDENKIADENGYTLVVLGADASNRVGSHEVVFQADPALYHLHSLDMNAKGIISVKPIGGSSRSLGKIVLTTFINVDGLLEDETIQGVWRETEASGVSVVSSPGVGATGSLAFGQ